MDAQTDSDASNNVSMYICIYFYNDNISWQKLNVIILNYFQTEPDLDYLEEMSKKWALAQMKHHVSAEAANEFWDLSFKFVQPCLLQRTKKVPKFIQQRRKMIQNYCPPVQVEFYYRNKLNGEIITHKGTSAPNKMYQNNNYEKLYEVAYVKVIDVS